MLTFWKEKINSNVQRDQRNYQKLSDMGWKVLIVWECELKPHKIDGTLNGLIDNIKNNC